MSVKTRVITFIVGVVFTIVGALLTYFEFFGKGEQWYMDNSYFAFGILLTGIVLVMIAFEKKKKPTEQDPGSPSKQ